MASPGRRKEMDLMKLMMAEYDVVMGNANSEFFVKFRGPVESPYEGGVWKVHVDLPEAYPYKSPSIGFVNRIFHPNVDEISGSVCLDVINQSWSPMFDLINVFEVFLPQLLLYPNPTDPLNGEAAALLMQDPERYKCKVREYVRKYAQPEHLDDRRRRNDEGSEEEDGITDDESDSDNEDGPVGGADDEDL